MLADPDSCGGNFDEGQVPFEQKAYAFVHSYIVPKNGRDNLRSTPTWQALKSKSGSTVLTQKALFTASNDQEVLHSYK